MERKDFDLRKISESLTLHFRIKIKRNVTVQDGASSCPALPNKKHRRFLRCEIWCKKLFTNQLDTAFYARFPVVLNSYNETKKETRCFQIYEITVHFTGV